MNKIPAIIKIKKHHVLFALSCLILLLTVGCKASHFPTPIKTYHEGDNRVLVYDIDRDTRVDYEQVLFTEGGVQELRYDINEDGTWDIIIELAKQAHPKKILIGLDGVPYSLMKELYDQGYFQMFRPPSRLFSVLPAITEMFLTEFLGVRYPSGYGLSYFNKTSNRLEGSLLHGDEIAIWDDIYDYISPIPDKGLFYMLPKTGTADVRALKRVIRRLYDKQDFLMLHLDATDSLCHKFGGEELAALLKKFDLGLQEIYHEFQGNMEIILYSDHGNNLVESDRIAIEDFLTDQGFQMRSDGVYDQGDIYILATGLINAAYLYTHAETEPKIAESLKGLDGVLFSMYHDENTDDVILVSEDGQATLSKDENFYRYTIEDGDPLELEAIVKQLKSEGRMRADGFIEDADWLQKTANHKYPDIIHLAYKAMTSLVVHKADVMVFLEDKWLCGSPALNLWLRFKSTHASPTAESVTGILMSTDQILPEYVRAKDVLDIIGLRDMVNERLREKNIEMKSIGE